MADKLSPSSEPTTNTSAGIKAAPLPPRAWSIPFLGNTFGFLGDTTKLLNESYLKYGPAFRLRALWMKYTVIGGFEARDALFNGIETKLSRHEVFDEIGRQLGVSSFVLAESGANHARLRRVLSVAYSREVASHFVTDFIDSVRTSIRSCQVGDKLGVMRFVEAIAFEQYCRAMCGQSLSSYYSDARITVNYNMNVGGRVWPFFMLRMPNYQRARKRIRDLIWRLVRERRHGLTSQMPPTIMDTLLRVTDAQGKQLTDDEIVCYSMYGFAGSVAYMSRLVGFMLYEILEHPEVYTALTDEVDRAFAAGIEDAGDVRAMSRLRAVYHESLRYHPVSQGLPYYAREDFVFEGKRIRKGDIVVLSQVPMSFSSCPFREPHKFDVDRCLPPREEHREGSAFHPYGIGDRTCTAMGLVELMSMTLVATLLHELEIKKFPPDYTLRLTVKPLPAPTSKFALNVVRRRKAGNGVGASSQICEERMAALFAGADNARVRDALAHVKTRRFERGEVIIQCGDPADAFYILLSGHAEVVEGEQPRNLANLAPGDYFGEIGLLLNLPRTATVRVTGDEPAECAILDKEDFLHIVCEGDLVSDEIARLLRRRLMSLRLMEAMPRLTAFDVERHLPNFECQTFEPGSVIVREGDKADRFYVILDGQVTVESQQKGQIAILKPGHYFGEIGIMTGLNRRATVRASGERSLVVMSIDGTGFRALVEESGGAKSDLTFTLATRLLGRTA